MVGSPASAIGMRRLSIIDLAGGHQPIHNEDGTVWIVFNGEIYNFRELRAELEAAGHRFYTSTDTEVIVHAYEQWGSGGDRPAARHVRARDLGHPATDRCCSRAIGSASSRCTTPRPAVACTSDRRSSRSCARPDVPRDIDLDALDHYLSFLYTPRDRSIFTRHQEAPARPRPRLARRTAPRRALLGSCRPTRRSADRRRTPSPRFAAS